MSDPFRFDPVFDDLGTSSREETPARASGSVLERWARLPGGSAYGQQSSGSFLSQFAGTPRPGGRLDAPLDEDEDEEASFREKAQRAAMGGIRFLASALEPLQLPQDIFFATLEAGLDDDKSLLENLREIEWAKYAPGGAAPARVTDGATILSLVGVENERAQKWGGLLMDLVVDPLIFGATLRWAGKATDIAELVHLGNRMDRMVAPSAWGRTAYDRIPEVKRAVDDITTHVLDALRNPDAKLFGAVNSDTLNRLIDWALPRRTALRGRFKDPELARRIASAPQIGEQRAADILGDTGELMNNLRAMMGDDMATDTARRVLKSLGQIRRAEVDELGRVPTIVRDAMAREGYDLIRQNPIALTPGLGFTDEVDNLFNVIDGRRVPDELVFDPAKALGRAADTPRNVAQRELASARWKDVYQRSLARGESERVARSRAWKARQGVPDQTPPMVTQQAIDNFEQSADRIRQLARDQGYGDRAEEFADMYRTFVTKIAAKKAEIGFELSGMRILQKVVMKRGADVFGSTEDGVRLWRQVLHEGVSREGGLDRWLNSSSGIRVGDSVTLTERGLRQAELRREASQRAIRASRERNPNLTDDELEAIGRRSAERLPEPEVDVAATEAGRRLGALGASAGRNETYKWREVIGDEWEGFSALGAGEYLNGLRQGHLYRAYGIWQTSNDMREWARRIEEGIIIPNNILDEVHVMSALQDSGFRNEARLMQDYIEATTRSAKGSREVSGRVVNTRRLATHIAEGLEAQGLAKRAAGQRAAEAVQQMRRAAQGQLGERARLIREEVIPAFEAEAPGIRAAVPGARFTPRQEFIEEQLETLGEMADPIVSMMEDAAALTGRLPPMDLLRAVFEEGTRAGMIRKGRHVDETGVVFQRVEKGSGLPEAFWGRYIHPQLMAETRSALKAMDYTPNRLQHIRSLITGGYLAAPNILVANVAGGLLSAWEAGISPHRMLRAMTQTWRPLHQDGGRHYELLRELRSREAVSLQSISMQDVGRQTRDFKLSQVALEPQGLRRAFKEITEFYEYILQGGPQATRWAGLSGFQFTERWMKTSIYKAMKDAGKTAEEAAELARIGVFDYCVDEETEALTDRGWLKLDEIDPATDRVLTVNPETNVSEWQPLKELYVGEARPREMHRLSSGRFDALVTADHRWITDSHTGKRRMKRLREFNKAELIVASGGEFKAPTVAQYPDELVELIGWYVTEGTNQARGHGVQIAQSLRHNPEYVVQLRALAEFYRARGATVSEYQRDVGWGTIVSFYFGKGVGNIIRRLAPDKRLTPDFLTRLTKAQLQLLFDTVVAADGHVKDGTIIYTQADSGRLDDFQFLAALLGYRTGRRPVYQEGVEAVTAYRTKHVHYHDLKKSVEPYKGRVWCPVTPNGTWFARRGGMTYWTGNSELPQALRFARDYGVLLFPGFPYFMTARTVQAALNNPGRVALVDRMAEGVNQAFAANDEEQIAMWLNMPDYLKEDQGVPIGRLTDPAGDERMSFIPLNQLLPTNTFGGNPFAESLATGGLYRPFMEALYAHLEGSGQAPFSARYGQQVFSPEQSVRERAQATLSFLFNNLAPSNVRKLYSPQSGEGIPDGSLFERVFENAEGVLPRLVLPRELIDQLYTFDEISRTRAERTLKDAVIGASIRSSRPIAQEGPLIGIRNEFASARRDHGQAVSALRERIQRAQTMGRTREAEQLQEQLRRLDLEFRTRWATWLEMAQER